MRFAALLAILLATVASAVEPNPLGTPPPLGLTSRAVVANIVDGDTLDLQLTLKVRIRLLDCWTAERFTDEGKRATAALESLLPVGSDVVLHVPTEDATSLGSVLTFGRALGHVWQAGSRLLAVPSVSISGLSDQSESSLLSPRESYHECDFDTASAIELAEVRVRRWVGQDRLELAEQWVRQFIYFWHGSEIKPGIIPAKGEPGTGVLR